ncbi:polysaccharide deacetylase family protein [Pedobacter aquatilis]|uniref:polysaccharide deacetylase family protein n=1 Tax=Pedobacter aquatilis TaxID=351343 RepID=UPI0025B40F0B|nr:polysaccharide deacetylase family protein [Pedobacter aquatilis]MDN3586632.1 polysaccharide deacetylase family protein [Pedobacter aquatilis]
MVFTGDEFADGGSSIQRTLKEKNVKASFFLTGNFYRNKSFYNIINELKADGHYLGAHSNKHLLYCDWQKRDSILVTEREFRSDLLANYKEMERFGVFKKDAEYFLPPYEWYNQQISDWTKVQKLQLINFSPGTRSNADYTYPELGKAYRSSDEILKSIKRYNETNSKGLNGFILLLHIGTDPRRTDKFYNHLGELITYLQQNGYYLTRIDDLLNH